MPSDAQKNVHDIVMIGAGPSSLTAAIYTTRGEIDTTIIERGVVGGLPATTDWIDNYPGFPDGIAGMELADKMRLQAERFGTKIELGEVLGIKDEGEFKKLDTTDGDVYAKAVLISSGSGYRKLGIPGEEEYYARGVHYCATCDGAFYRDKKLVVVGGGNSALQEAMFLTRFASHIDLLVRGDKMRATEILQRQVAEKFADKITVHMNTTTDEIVGAEVDGMQKVTKVIGTDKSTNQKVEFLTDGVFVFVGLIPNTTFLEGTNMELDEVGFIKTNDKFETSMPGVFAAGDVRSGAVKQVAVAVGEGASVSSYMREYLEDHARKYDK